MPQRKVSYKFGTNALAKYFSITGHGGLLEPVLAQGVTEFFDAGIGCIEYTTTMPNSMQLVKEGVACLPKDLLL